MKSKFLWPLLCLLLSLSLIFGATAAETTDSTAQAEALLGGILEQHLQKNAVEAPQGWLDGALAQNAGVLAEWYVLALSQYGDYDFSAYQSALLAYLDGREVYSAVTRQKYALALIGTGSADAYIAHVMENSIGEQGIMSYVYGLHLLCNGYASTGHTVESVTEALLAMQLSDGGFALSGDVGNVDVTAMAVQALAHQYGRIDAVTASVDRAIAFLASKQAESGDFISYGVKNPESAAQVLSALSAVGIDCAEDARFLKSGETLLDVIAKYRLEDGSFCHTAGGVSNENATAQVFCAAVAYLRLKNGEGAFYLMDRRDPSALPEIPIEDTPQDENSPTVDGESDPTTIVAPRKWYEGYRFQLSAVVLGLGGLTALLLYLFKKRHIKNFAAVILATALLITLVAVTDLQSADDYYGELPKSKENVIGSVTLSIRCDAVPGKSDAAHIPDDGVILATAVFSLAEGETVYDILIEAARTHRIALEHSGGYIVGIGHIYELDFGPLSGWTYRVNGEYATVGSTEYLLSDGDVIEWVYTTELDALA